MQTVSIIGAGRVGGALALALGRAGFGVENLFVRRPESVARAASFAPGAVVSDAADYGRIRSEIVFITTPDDAIAAAALDLAGKLQTAPVVLHTSGALASDVLEPLKIKACPVGSLHPLVSLSDPVRGAEHFAGANFCVEGDPAAVEAARKIADALGGRSFSIATRYKTLYHAAAVTASGHLVALTDVALEMLGKCGLSEKDAQATLLPLIISTVDNLALQTPAEALTGTFARADVETFEKHLAALAENVSDEVREVYLQLGARSAHLAQRRGVDGEKLALIREKISLAKKDFRC
ncbi:MAG: DUF2520 domain-containing protein [Acidobacteria bacterium]|nr:DUF2520 domain-containing protein [Acidobacteriota bacterium]